MCLIDPVTLERVARVSTTSGPYGPVTSAPCDPLNNRPMRAATSRALTSDVTAHMGPYFDAGTGSGSGRYRNICDQIAAHMGPTSGPYGQPKQSGNSQLNPSVFRPRFAPAGLGLGVGRDESPFGSRSPKIKNRNHSWTERPDERRADR